MDEFAENGSAAMTPTPPRKRNQYNLEFKLEVASQYTPGVPGRGFEALAREYGLSKSNVMHWVAKKELMTERLAVAGGSGAARNSFRLDGCGRKSVYGELEDELEQWVVMQTARGERVKDKDLQEKAMLIFRDMHPDVPADSENSFKASSGWVARFKQRKNFSVRRGSKTAAGGDGDEDAAAPVAAPTGTTRNDVGAAGAQMTPPQQQRRVPVLRAAKPAPAPVATPPPKSTATVSTVSTTATAANGRKGPVAATIASGMKRPAATAATQTSQRSATALDPDMCVVSVEWMQAVDQKFSDLAQQISYLAEGQNLLLGMLQRMTPLSQPARSAVGGSANGAATYSSSPMRNGLFSPSVSPAQPPLVVYETAPAAHDDEEDEDDDEQQQLPTPDVTPDVTPNKRRRVSIANNVV